MGSTQARDGDGRRRRAVALTSSTETAARRKAEDITTQVRDQDLVEVARYMAATAHSGQIVQILNPAGAIVAASGPTAAHTPLTSLRPGSNQTLKPNVAGLESTGDADAFLIIATCI